MNERGVIKVKLGGVERTLRVEIEQGAQIEEELGVGVLTLFRVFVANQGRMIQAAEIIRAVLMANGVVVSRGDVLGMFKVEGLLNGLMVANRILGEFFNVPGDIPKGKAPNGAALTTEGSQ